MQKFKVFGASLDALDLQEKIDLKLAYISSLKGYPRQEFPLDPYDAVEAFLERKNFPSSNIEWIGKFPIESWLSPKPTPADEPFIKKASFTEFLDSNGCLTYSNKLTSYLRNHVHPSKPVMIGVDHSLTGGVIRYLAESLEDFNVLFFDSHTDIMDFATKQSVFTSTLAQPLSPPSDIYECGSFINDLLNEKLIKPDHLWILGTQDLAESPIMGGGGPYGQKLRDWVGKGVHLISKSDLIRNGIPKEIEGPTYISIDIDVASYSSVLACRFMDRIGLDYEQLMMILGSLSEMIRGGNISVLGVDIMELDVHFMDEEISGKQDCSLMILEDVFKKLIMPSLN